MVPLVEMFDNPMGCKAVQFRVAPGTLLNVTKADVSPEQIVWFGNEKVTAGEGFTVMIKVWVAPRHPLAVGVTLIVAVIGAVVVFFGVNAGIFPVPLRPKPIAEFEFAHE